LGYLKVASPNSLILNKNMLCTSSKKHETTAKFKRPEEMKLDIKRKE
jgi:hypothetical protein